MREWCRCRESRNRANVIEEGRHPQRRHAGNERSHLVHVSRFLIVVDQRNEIDRRPFAQPLKDVKRAQAIAPIRGVRQAVGEEKNAHVYADGPPPRSRKTRAGTPPAITRSAIGLVTTAPAPMTESLPTSAITIAALPIQAPAPMRTGALTEG